MLDSEAKQRTESATVRFVGMDGQGTLVPGGLIITAAHCIEWSIEGGMVLGDHRIEAIETRSGLSLRAATIFVDPVADIAVLASLDNQEFSKAADAFEDWVESTDPVPVRLRDFELEENLRVHVLTHHRTWIEGHAQRWAPVPSGSVFLETPGIEGGTSGGPIVNDEGQLVGVVSNMSEGLGASETGTMPVPFSALPLWVVQRIQKG